MKIIFVRWQDSAVVPEWSHLAKNGLSEIVSVGYLVFEDKKHIQIAQSIDRADEKYGSILSIPKSVILKIRVLEKFNES